MRKFMMPDDHDNVKNTLEQAICQELYNLKNLA